MREIKFRGLNTKGEWVYGDLIKTSTSRVDGSVTCWIKPNDRLGLGAISTPTDNFIEVNPETVGQFTGAYDEQGEEIWEGDIYWNGEDDYWPCIVAYDGKNGCFTSKSVGGGHGDFSDLQYDNYVKVGNIHDNPELTEPAEC